jgi:predicted permease
MSANSLLVQSVTVLLGIVALAYALRRWAWLREEHSVPITRLVTDVTVPALILSAFMECRIEPNQFRPALIMIASELVTGLLAWVVGRVLRLTPPRMGALILAATFGSSAFFGYAFVANVFGGDPQALVSAAIVSELGVAMPLFTVGQMIAIHYGRRDMASRERWREIARFFRSPIFFALVAGVILSQFDLPRQSVLVDTIRKWLASLASANTLLVMFTIGLMLNPQDLRCVLPLILLACALKLIVQPGLVHGGALALHTEGMGRRVLVLEAAMPSAAMNAVFARRFGCDADLASILVLTTCVSALVTVVMVASIW